MMTADVIKELIATVDGVGLVDDFTIGKAGSLIGRISVDTGLACNGLIWEVEISPSYPFKAMGVEPISFVNRSLLDYSHIMQGGNLCMHPAEYESAESQFVNDLEQIKEWVNRYYLKGEKDEHYEHLVVNHHPIRERYCTFCFAETQEDFDEGDYGEVRYAALATGYKNGIPVDNYVVQKFVSVKQVKKKERSCMISEFYRSLRPFDGVYCLLETVCNR